MKLFSNKQNLKESKAIELRKRKLRTKPNIHV